MKQLNHVIFILVSSTLMCCSAILAPEPPPIVNDPVYQPTPDEANDDVERVCGKLRALGCDEGANTYEGNTCETVLRNAALEDIDLVGDVECTMSATSCEFIRKNCE